MNTRAAEREIVKNFNSNTSLTEIYSLSQADRNLTNLVLMKLLNKYHIHAARIASTSSPIYKISSAA